MDRFIQASVARSGPTTFSRMVAKFAKLVDFHFGVSHTWRRTHAQPTFWIYPFTLLFGILGFVVNRGEDKKRVFNITGKPDCTIDQAWEERFLPRPAYVLRSVNFGRNDFHRPAVLLSPLLFSSNFSALPALFSWYTGLPARCHEPGQPRGHPPGEQVFRGDWHGVGGDTRFLIGRRVGRYEVRSHGPLRWHQQLAILCSHGQLGASAPCGSRILRQRAREASVLCRGQ